MTNDPLIERLADLEHQQWMHWAEALIREECGLSPERIARWRSSFTSYADLPDPLKELDRTWARRALALITEETKP